MIQTEVNKISLQKFTSMLSNEEIQETLMLYYNYENNSLYACKNKLYIIEQVSNNEIKIPVNTIDIGR